MSEIVLLDTSVFLNLLDVPQRNQRRAEVLDGFERCIQDRATLLLPLVVALETGNHIGHLPDGRQRRQFAEAFKRELMNALSGIAPYIPTHFPDRDEFLRWCIEWPEHAAAGRGIGDLSIVKEWERARSVHPGRRVRIWALDRDLDGHDTGGIH